MLRHCRVFAGLLRIDYMSALTGRLQCDVCFNCTQVACGLSSICTDMAGVWCCGGCLCGYLRWAGQGVVDCHLLALASVFGGAKRVFGCSHHQECFSAERTGDGAVRQQLSRHVPADSALAGSCVQSVQVTGHHTCTHQQAPV